MNSKITKYLIPTFLCTWITWGLIALGGKLGISSLIYGKPIAMILYIIGGLSPTFCAIVIQKRDCSIEEFKIYLKSIVAVKHSIWLYLYAIGGAIILLCIPALTGYSSIKQPFYMGFIMTIPMVFGGGLEEIGWRGLLQPELEKKFSVIVTPLLVGILWSLWHLPLWFIEGSSQQNMNYLWFCINALILSYYIGSVRNLSGSIFLAILSHATFNGFWDVMPASNSFLPSLIILGFIIILNFLIKYRATKRKL